MKEAYERFRGGEIVAIDLRKEELDRKLEELFAAT